MSHQTTRRSFSKFKRQPEDNKIVLQKRDLEILKLVYEYRFIQSDQITALMEASHDPICRRLQKLFHNGYLDRFVDLRRIRVRTGSDKMAYAITRKTGSLLASEAGLDWAKIDWDTKNRKMSEPYIKHTLMISNFRATLTLACRAQKNLNIESWIENRGTGQNVNKQISDRVWIEGKDGREKRLPVVPDAFFRLLIDDEEDFLFLEADRGTMSASRFLLKLLAYKAWREQGGFEKKFDHTHFRVLTVAPSNERRDSLREAAESLDRGGMFWFTSEKYYSLDYPESIFQNIWLTGKAKDSKLHSLIE